MNLIDQVALVIGGSRGIGRHIAIALASEGCHTAVSGRDTEAMKDVVQAIKNTGSEAMSIKMDVRKTGDIQRGIDRVMKKFGHIDILVNNAGIGAHQPLETMKPQEIHKMIEVNLIGPIECCRRVIPIMKKQKQGCIINIASKSGANGVANMAVYAATKWALRGLGFSLSEELRKDNIRVHNICPGTVDTEFFENNMPPDHPMRKTDPELMLQADDIAQAAVYLATLSERARVEEIQVGARKIWMSRD